MALPLESCCGTDEKPECGYAVADKLISLVRVLPPLKGVNNVQAMAGIFIEAFARVRRLKETGILEYER